MKIGFIGLGIMGSRLAANLVKTGNELIVYNRSTEKAADLVAQGAKLSKSLEELAKEVDVVFTMLSTPQVVKETAGALLPNLKPESWWVDCSTVNPSFSKEMNIMSEKHSIQFVDAPVAGSKAPAESGELLFLAGGKEEELSFLEPCFDAMGKKTLYLNEVGNGANMKMLINLLLAQSMTAFSEAISLGIGMGLNEGLLLNILTATPVVAPFLAAIKPRLENDVFDVNFPLKWIHKDIILALDTAEELGVDMKSLDQTEALYKRALERGLGDEDFSAIYKSL